MLMISQNEKRGMIGCRDRLLTTTGKLYLVKQTLTCILRSECGNINVYFNHYYLKENNGNTTLKGSTNLP